MGTIKDFSRLIRWQNLLFVALVIWLMEKMVAVPLLLRLGLPEQLPAWVFYLLMLSVVFIAAGGYVINDYFDVKIDQINRPDRLIVTRTFTKQQAMLFHQVLTAIGVVAGIVVAVYLRSWSLALIYILVPGLLWFYSSSYKRQFIVGNLIVALTAALVPLMVALANAEYLKQHYAEYSVCLYAMRDLYQWIGAFALFDLLTTFIREVIKDLQDQAGDRELECHTLPIRLGNTWTKVIVTLLILLVAAGAAYAVYACLPFPHQWSSLSVRYLVFGLLVPLACELYLLWSAQLPSDYRVAQGLMKFVMLLGVLFSIVIKAQL